MSRGWRVNRIVAIIISLLSIHSLALSKCLNEEKKNLKIQGANGLEFSAFSCETSQSTYRILLQFYKNKKLVKVEKMNAKGAYSLSINNDIDVNDDGIFDISVANGKGKSGGGMDYWLIRNQPPFMTSLGDFPEIKRSKTRNRVLYSVIPGGGEIISTRYEYKLFEGKLHVSRAITAKILSNGFYETQALSYDLKSKSWTPKGARANWSESQLSTCMSGGQCEIE